MSNHQEVTATANFGMGRKTLKAYVIGLVLSILFTLGSFGIVEVHSLSNPMIFVLLAVLAIAQFIAQVVFFLRMNVSPEGRWNSMSFIFALVIVAVLVFGSLWIMVNLNYNMVH